MAVLTNTETEPFWLGYNRLKKLTPLIAKLLERTQEKMIEEALPTWQSYTGRYVITDPKAIPTLTFSTFDIGLVNKKLVVTVRELLPGSLIRNMKEIPLAPYGKNVFYIGEGGTFFGSRITFESSQDGGA